MHWQACVSPHAADARTRTRGPIQTDRGLSPDRGEVPAFKEVEHGGRHRNAGHPEQAKDCDPVEGHAPADDETPGADAVPAPRALPAAMIRRGGTINDASCTEPYGGVRSRPPADLGQLRELLAFAAGEELHEGCP
ncbi:MAG: hypothetical protein GEU74_07890 [Nitriliruptorales bacterium]|nr:hypothetical protein [Nitriliruptorales bacterium]